MRKENLRKVVLCSIADCFTKPFKKTINHFFYFVCSFAAEFLLFEIRRTQEISKAEIGNDKWLGIANTIFFSKIVSIA